MTATDPAGPPPPGELTARIADPAIGELARQISPAATAASLTRALTARGVAGIYTNTAARFGLISVTATVTAWTNGHQIWCTCAGQHHTWPAADIEAAAANLAALARP
jgi:hypothetical protein